MDAIVNAAKDPTAALKGNVSGTLGEKSLDALKKLKSIFAQKARSYKTMSQVVAQPPRVREEAATPPRVVTPTSSPNMIRQEQRSPGDYPPARECQRIHEIPDEYGIIEEVTELRPIPIHPNEDDDDGKEIPAQPIFITQDETKDAPARNTRLQRSTMTQEVIYL